MCRWLFFYIFVGNVLLKKKAILAIVAQLLGVIHFLKVGDSAQNYIKSGSRKDHPASFLQYITVTQSLQYRFMKRFQHLQFMLSLCIHKGSTVEFKVPTMLSNRPCNVLKTDVHYYRFLHCDL